MADPAVDVPAPPDGSFGLATEDSFLSSVQAFYEAEIESYPGRRSDGLEERRICGFIYQGSEFSREPSDKIKFDNLTQYMVGPNAALGDQKREQSDLETRRSSFTSFGDQGTTATVNSNGQIMQITSFLDIGKSGFLCADDYYMPSPYWVRDRAHELMMSTESYTGIGFFLRDYNPAKLDFVSNRWPRFTRTTDDYILRTQYFVCNGSIFQQYVFEEFPQNQSDQSSQHPQLDSLFELDSDIQIRDLDWQDKNYKFNTDGYSANSYKTFLYNDRFSLVRAHTGLPRGSTAHRVPNEAGVLTVELVVTAFLNGRPQRLKQYENSELYGIDISVETAKAEFNHRRRLEITVAYKLQLASKKEERVWMSRLVFASQLSDMRQAFSEDDSETVRLSQNDDLNFVVHRNLEHVLSVCSVPVSTTRASHQNVIALTCGDLSGHRIVNSASFFAFQFLISIHSFLQKTLDGRKDCQKCYLLSQKPSNVSKVDPGSLDGTQGSNDQLKCSYCRRLQGLLARIHTTCKGHMNWVFKIFRESYANNQTFGPNHWASGQRIQGLADQSPRYLAPESATDTAFQLINVEGFYNMNSGRSGEDSISKKVLKRMVTSWFAQLSEAERRPERGPYAFARSTDDMTGNDNYYLEDHAWIWRALDSLRNIGLDERQNLKVRDKCDTVSITSHASRTGDSSRNYSSTEAQRHMLKRFTTENPALKRRMLAVFRSSTETRFMLRSRDTALFHCMESKFFNMADSANIVDVWRSTLVAQVSHEENQTVGWDNPLRYALALAMASKGWKINRDSTNNTIREARDVLYRSSRVNGLFPGFLNHATKDSEIFQDADYRDTFWHVTFEIPYLLWTHAKPSPEEDVQQSGTRTSNKLYLAPRENLGEDLKVVKLDPYNQETSVTREVVVTKKSMPFNNLIDQQSIVEPPDEWLYNEPDFLKFSPHPVSLELIGRQSDLWNMMQHFEKEMKASYTTPEVPNTSGGSFEDPLVPLSGPLNEEVQSLHNQLQSMSASAHSDMRVNMMFRDLMKDIEAICAKHYRSIAQQQRNRQTQERGELPEQNLLEIREGDSSAATPDSGNLERGQPDAQIQQQVHPNSNGARSMSDIFRVVRDIEKTIILDKFPYKWEETFKSFIAQLRNVVSRAETQYSISAALSRLIALAITNTPSQASSLKGVVVDVPRSTKKSTKGKTLSDPLEEALGMTNSQILQRLSTRHLSLDDQKSTDESLSTPRADGDQNPPVIKKRLVWLPCADLNTAVACSLAAPDSEKEGMQSFFDRHAAYEKFFFDDTTAALNTWKTELQLAFYQLTEKSTDIPSVGIPGPRPVSFPTGNSGQSDPMINRATMGFRFNGDFFDRYWTCYFIECKSKRGQQVPNVDPSELSTLLQPQKHLPKSEREKQPWRQRKVLELILFDNIVEKITSSTHEIMDRIRTELQKIRAKSRAASNDASKTRIDQDGSDLWLYPMSPRSQSAPAEVEHGVLPEKISLKADALEDALHAAKFVSKMKGESYLSFSEKSQAFEQVLRVLDDDLGENLEQIERWARRERDRAPERPRWTRNDERRYRTTIIKMLASNDRRIRALQQCRANVQSLKTSLESTREYIRDDLNLRGAEDIRLFTYVTATFLPISFATSVFSMGGFPGGALLGSMVALATVALLLTGIALVYDKKLAIVARGFRDFFLNPQAYAKEILSRITSLIPTGNESESSDANPGPNTEERVRRHTSGNKFSGLRRRERSKIRNMV